ncbi:MAG: T9SS type A sorting domain-containing protein [bacterium]
MKKILITCFLFTVAFAILVFSVDSIAQCQPYLGQTPPDITPVRFAPNNSYKANGNWWWRSAPMFSPDGDEMYFVKYFSSTETHEIWYTKCVNGQWTEPTKAPFSTNTFDGNPMFLQSNDTLYFYSQRQGGFVFSVTRTETGWSEPDALNIPLPANSAGVTSFYITKNKNVYFAMLDSSLANPDIWSSADIYKTELVDGQYIQPENIGLPINSNVGEVVGYVDPDERFMIFESKRTDEYGLHDLYISNKNQDGTWSDPINLGAKINTAEEDGTPQISPDGKYFFFTTLKTGDYGYTPYWVDASVIYDLITDVKDEQSNPTGFNLFQNYPNPFNPSTTIKFSIAAVETPYMASLQHVTLKIYDILGREVVTLVNKEKPAGNYEVTFNASNLSSGIYFYQLVAGKFQEIKKMVLLQ